MDKQNRKAVIAGNWKMNMTPAEAKLAKFCPECGARLEHEGGCVTCRDCGYSKCG